MNRTLFAKFVLVCAIAAAVPAAAEHLEPTSVERFYEIPTLKAAGAEYLAGTDREWMGIPIHSAVDPLTQDGSLDAGGVFLDPDDPDVPAGADAFRLSVRDDTFGPDVVVQANILVPGDNCLLPGCAKVVVGEPFTGEGPLASLPANWIRLDVFVLGKQLPVAVLDETTIGLPFGGFQQVGPITQTVYVATTGQVVATLS